MYTRGLSVQSTAPSRLYSQTFASPELYTGVVRVSSSHAVLSGDKL